MLLSGAAYPLTFNKDEQIRYMMAEYDLDSLDTPALKQSFQTEYESRVYRLTHKEWGEPPHVAEAYFNENKKLILFTAMTARCFRISTRDGSRILKRLPRKAGLRWNRLLIL